MINIISITLKIIKYFSVFFINFRIEEIEVACKLQSDFQRSVYRWKEMREQTIRMVREIPQKLVDHQSAVNNSRISKIAGISGGGLAVLGLALISFTFDTSAALMITGSAIVAASVVTASKINIADRILCALNAVNGAEKQIVCDLEMLTEIEHIQHQITEQNEKIRKKCKDLTGKDILRMIAMHSSPSANVNLRVSFTELRSISHGRYVLRGLLALINPDNGMLSAVNIHQGSKGEVEKELYEKANELERDKENVLSEMGLIVNKTEDND